MYGHLLLWKNIKAVSIVGGFLTSALLSFSVLAETVKGWSEVAAMSFPRSEIQAAYLDEKVYVAGGIGYYRTSQICEVFDMVVEKWNRCPDLPNNLHHTAMASDGKKVFAGGGYTSIIFADKLSFSYDETPKLWALTSNSETWVEVADLPEPVAEHNFVYAAGQLYLIGGETALGTSNKVWVFDQGKKTWIARAPMPTSRYSAAAVELDGEIWVIGGRSDIGGLHLDAVEAYDPSSNTWRTAAAMPDGRAGHAAAVWQGQIHVFGGERLGPLELLEHHQVFDTKANAWRDAALPPKARHGWAAVSTPEGVYLIGGGAMPGYDTIHSVTGTTQIWNGVIEKSN